MKKQLDLDFEEFHKMPSFEAQTKCTKSCNNCGVPFCQAGMMIAGMASGCPLHNLVPETNELVAQGNYEYVRHFASMHVQADCMEILCQPKKMRWQSSSTHMRTSW